MPRVAKNWLSPSGRPAVSVVAVGTLVAMSDPGEPSVPAGHEDPTRPEPVERGRVVVVTYNHIAAAITAIADVVGRPTVVLDDRGGHSDPVAWLTGDGLRVDDSLVVCDHDSPGALDLLRAALRGRVGYVAMMGSRRRAEHVFAQLAEEGFDADALARLRVPAGLNVGGKAPGEIALSVMAEIVATSYDRDGAPMSAAIKRDRA